jgi:hypothetical protein
VRQRSIYNMPLPRKGQKGNELAGGIPLCQAPRRLRGQHRSVSRVGSMRVVGGSRAFLADRLREAHARLPPMKTQRPDLQFLSSIQHLGFHFLIPLLYSLGGKNTVKRGVDGAIGEIAVVAVLATASSRTVTVKILISSLF